MKIDFNAGYKGVSDLIFRKEARASDPSVRAQFRNIEQQIPHASLKPIEIIKKDEIFKTAQQPAGSAMQHPAGPVQSYAMPSPTTILPEMPRQTVDESSGESVNSMPGPVKSPTVLEARRVAHGRDILPGRASAPSNAVPREEITRLIETAGGKHGIDPALGLAVANAESSFNPGAVSSDGHYSKGLFQLLDSTGKDMMSRLKVAGDYEPFNPELNTDLGMGYLRYLHDLFSSSSTLPNNITTRPAANSSALEKLAVAAFNAGEGRVAAAQRQAEADGLDASQYTSIESYLPEITQKYVQRVTGYRAQFDAPVDLDSVG